MKITTRTALSSLVLACSALGGFTACSSDAAPGIGGGGSAGSSTAGNSNLGGSSSAGSPSAGSAGSVTAGAPAGGASGSGAGGAAGGSPQAAGAGGAQAGSSGAAGAGSAVSGGGGSMAGGGAGAGGGSAGGGGSTHTGPWRITPLGDSITGTTCGPQLLSKELKAQARTNFSFIGTNLNNQSCNGAPNVQTEGHGGYLVTDLVGNGKHASELGQWTSADKPDVVLMHFGTNDVWSNIAPQTILAAYGTVLDSLRGASPKVIVFVAQIIPMNPDGCTACESRVEALNAQIPGWASSKSTTASPIYVVDQHSVFVASSYKPNSMYTSDGVHPNAAGGQLMADKWYSALTAKAIP